MTNQPWTGRDPIHHNTLPIKPNHPFWYMHHPNTCWEFVNYQDQWLFIPSFRRLFQQAGVNGVRMVPRGGADSQMARVRMMDDGFEVLDIELGYQSRYKCRGGYFYANVFDTPKVLGNRVIWKRDDKAWIDWRLDLLRQGILKQPDEDILSLFIERQEKRVERNEGKNMTPRLKKMYDLDINKLNKMIECVENGNKIIQKKKGKRSV